jgi:hypothetical protein
MEVTLLWMMPNLQVTTGKWLPSLTVRFSLCFTYDCFVINNQSSFILNDVEILQNSIDSCFIEASRYASVTSLQDLRVCTVRQTNISRHFFLSHSFICRYCMWNERLSMLIQRHKKCATRFIAIWTAEKTSYVLQQNLSQERIIF